MSKLPVKKTCTFLADCVGADGDEVNAMRDTAIEITLATFRSYIHRDAYTELLAYFGYPRRNGKNSFCIKNDWHVSYHRSTFRTLPCVYMRHSGIEHIYTANAQKKSE